MNVHDEEIHMQCPCKRYCGKNHGKATSFSTTTSARLKLASLTTFKTMAAINWGATPCFQIYFGDVGGLLEHRDILQNSSETAMHLSICSFRLDPLPHTRLKSLYVLLSLNLPLYSRTTPPVHPRTQ